MRLLSNRSYGLLILATLISAALYSSATDWFNARATRMALEPVWTPWAWHGIACHSEISFHDPNIPFTIHLLHPPTRERAVVNATIQELPEQNSSTYHKPWPETDLERYWILNTRCFDTWEHLYTRWVWFTRSDIDARLPTDHTPSEEEYRQAILGAHYPDHFEAADRLFPRQAALLQVTETPKE